MSNSSHRFIVESVLEKFRADGLSFDDAMTQTRHQFSTMDIVPIDDLLAEIHEEELAKRHRTTKFADTSTSRQKDLLEHPWYNGQTQTNGHWEHLRARMEQSGLADSVEEIHGSTEAIMSCTAEPKVPKDKRLGLE